MKKSTICFTGILLLVTMQFQLKSQNFEDAIGLSHAGKYVEAEKVFSKLINEDKNNISFLIASGFNNAWSKKYVLAKQRFLKALELEPVSTDAAKGLAYTFLYEGSFLKAADDFEKLCKADPASAELHIALGLAYMNLQKKAKALKQFEEILRIDKSNTEAKKYMDDIKLGRGILELSSFAGISSYGNDSKFGVRQIQAGYHINSENFVYVRYDNALSLDNYFLQKNNFNTNAFIGGLYTRWHSHIGSKFEYGYRSLPENIKQNLYQTEQVIFLPENYLIKIGGSIITSNQLQKEWMLMTSTSLPITNSIKIEPHYYFIHRLANEHRVLINTSYNISPKTDIAVGIFAGKEKNVKLNIYNTVSGVFAYSNFYIKGPLSGTALTRYEKDATGRQSFIAAAGIKLTIDTKKF